MTWAFHDYMELNSNDFQNRTIPDRPIIHYTDIFLKVIRPLYRLYSHSSICIKSNACGLIVECYFKIICVNFTHTYIVSLSQAEPRKCCWTWFDFIIHIECLAFYVGTLQDHIMPNIPIGTHRDVLVHRTQRSQLALGDYKLAY